MYIFRALVKWGWCPVLITALAAAGFICEWPAEAIVTALVIILVIGLVVAALGAREKELERLSLQLRQLAGYFNRRFMGDSSLSIFAIIEGLFKVDEPKLWEWARACDMSRRVINTWCGSFVSRVESDIRTRRFDIYLHTYLNELWLVNSHYHEYITQFCEIGERVEIPREIRDQYNRFVVEYNAFVQDFRDNISELKKVAGTEIEPPSVQFARELPEIKGVL